MLAGSPNSGRFMKRRSFLLAGGTAAVSALLPKARAQAAPLPSISPTLTARDSLASENARNVYSRLVALENAARAGTSPMTVMGQHIEGQNELYNPGYGDTGGTTYVGYYYNKVEAITGKLPGFVEIDFGPDWNSLNGYSYQQLWQIMYDYLVNTRGLHNLIFVWSPSAWTPGGSDVPWNYYPGDAYVDVVAVDDYNPVYGSGAATPETSEFSNIYYAGLNGYAKPRMLAETYKVPVTANGTSALAASPWVIWTVWGQMLTTHNPDADIKATYYATRQVYTGGSGTRYGQNIDWGTFHTD